jgi:transposase-like protein
MAKQYSAEFKIEAVRRIERTKELVSKVARSGYYAWDKRSV